MKPTACLGYIRGHNVSGAWSESLLSAVIADVRGPRILDGRVEAVTCAHYLNVGRNILTKRLLEQYGHFCDVFVSLDTDHDFTPEQLWRLVSLVDPVHRPVVSGLYHACDLAGQQVRPVVIRRQGEELQTVWELPEDDFIECDVIGEGFRAVHISVLRKIEAAIGPRWFDFDATAVNRDFMPEDNAFCRRVQEIAGAKIYVHTGLDIGHEKMVRLRAADRRRHPRSARGKLKLEVEV